MEIKELIKRPEIHQYKRLGNYYNQFNKLLEELRKRELSDELVIFINDKIEQLNASSGSIKELSKQLRKSQSQILQKIEKDLKLVTINHYRNSWMANGMLIFGIPLGVVFGTSLGNMAFIGIGIPIGMAIGLAIGTDMDKKAFEEGRQLDLEIKN